jgi:hypothetical protein
MKKINISIFRNSLLHKYHKRISRLRKAVEEGSFSNYSFTKKRSLLQSLTRYEKQLSQWGIAFTTGLALLLPTSPVQAQTPLPVGSEFQVNTYTMYHQQSPAVAMDTDGNFVVAWMDQTQDGSFGGIYAQRYDNAGNPQGVEFQVNTSTYLYQNNPAVAMDSDGDFVVVWEDRLEDESFYGIYAQRYDNDAIPLGSEFRVNTNTYLHQQNPAIAMDSNGNFVVVWEDQVQDGSNYGVYAQRYDNTGAPQGVEFRVNTYTTFNQSNPAIAMDSDGDFVVIWQSFQDGSSNGIYAQRYDNTGAPQGAEFRVNTYTTSMQINAAVAMDSDGDFVVTWQSPQDGDGYGIYAQRYDNTGAPQGTEFRVNTYTFINQQNPSVAMDSNGDFVVAWEDQFQDGSGYGVYAQSYDNTGATLGTEFRVNTTTFIRQRNSSIAMDSDGDFVVTWEDQAQDGSNYGIYAQRYTMPPLLPIELLYFTGHPLSGSNILEWATATEKNAAWQIVQRSPNGLDSWSEIGRLTGAGNATTPVSYSFNDDNPLPLSFYRLVAEDFDGSIQYSEVISLQRTETELSIRKVFPQPAMNELWLDLNAPASGIIAVSLTDMLGRKVLNLERTVQRGNNQLLLDINGLPSGRYQVTISDGEQNVTTALVK